jgi:hypothetical protein
VRQADYSAQVEQGAKRRRADTALRNSLSSTKPSYPYGRKPEGGGFRAVDNRQTTKSRVKNTLLREAQIVETPLDQNANTRVRIAFFFLFIFIVALSVGAYFFDLSKLQENIAVRESQTALQGIAEASQINQALRQHPSNKILQMIAMAMKAAAETAVATESLSAEVEPPSLSKSLDLATASRSDLEALGRNLKTAEANATTFMPRYVALLKSERNKVEGYALSLHVEKDTVSRFLEQLDKRHAQMTHFTAQLLAARADYYRAYASYVAVLVGESGAYKVVNGQFIFPFQRTVDRYNVAAHAMTVGAKRVAELTDERKNLTQSQQQGWEQFVDRK